MIIFESERAADLRLFGRPAAFSGFGWYRAYGSEVLNMISVANNT
jgi:hypothetical protein